MCIFINNKPLYVESVTDYKMASELLGYTAIVGEFSSKKWSVVKQHSDTAGHYGQGCKKVYSSIGQA